MPAHYRAFFDPVKGTKPKVEDPTSILEQLIIRAFQRTRELSAGPPVPGSVIGSRLLPNTVEAFHGGLSQLGAAFGEQQPGGASDNLGLIGGGIDRFTNALFGSLRMAGSPLEAAFLSEIREPIVAGGETIGLDPAETGAQVDMVSI